MMPARMTRRSLARPIAVVAAFAVGAPLAACTSNPPDPVAQETTQIKQGQHLFARNCAM